ncbi:MAG TPA: GNAT family N-acetyltransferase [Myxococcaceae bacterium]|jgi:RimJ/RimL family protein N-acetyltransferase
MTTSISIDTDRLTLRTHRLDDFPDSRALWADPEVTRYIGGRPFTEEESWQRLLRYVGHWSLMGYGYWTVRERSSGRFAGEVGLANGRRTLDPPLGDAPESGWALAPWAHGRGYATEAVRAVLVWGAEHFGPRHRTVCMIAPENRPSLRVAEKCGYREYARTTYKGEPTILFERV